MARRLFQVQCQQASLSWPWWLAAWEQPENLQVQRNPVSFSLPQPVCSFTSHTQRGKQKQTDRNAAWWLFSPTLWAHAHHCLWIYAFALHGPHNWSCSIVIHCAFVHLAFLQLLAAPLPFDIPSTMNRLQCSTHNALTTSPPLTHKHTHTHHFPSPEPCL